MHNVTAKERLQAARIRLVRDHVFYGAVAMRLELVEVPDLPYLAAVDGQHIFFNPERIMGVPPAKLTGLLAHEALHVMLSHHLRIGTRKPRRWNVAGDHVINLGLIVDKFELPDGGLWDEQYSGMSTEEVYLRLPEDAGENGPKGFDNVMDGAKGMTETEVRMAEAQIKAAVSNAAALARKAGSMTAGMEKLVEAICQPKVDWRTELWQYLSEKAETDYNWSQPDKRMLQQYNIISPTLDGYKIGKVIVVNDTSGSTSRYQEQFASEISDILANYECEITVLNHDTTTTLIETYSSDDLPLTLKTNGYGGTCAKHTFDLIRGEYDFDVIIHLTDGDLRWDIVEDPGGPVLVVLTDPHNLERIPTWARAISIR